MDTTVSTIAALVKEREVSSEPHLINEKISALEMSAQMEQLRAYPTYIAINHMTKCNARCRFCFYFSEVGALPRLTTQDFSAMSWLKNISIIDLYGGLGEPLLNPDFCDIVSGLRQNNPTQRLQFTTNGQLLSKEVTDRLAGKVDSINISINAAQQSTYEFLMQGCHWNHLLENLEYFQGVNLSKPKATRLTFSYVLSRHNIQELTQLIPIMQRLNVRQLGLSHFSTNCVWPARDGEHLERTDSLYYNKHLYDDVFFEFYKKFKDAGIRIGVPPRFEEDSRIAFGARVRAQYDVPWQCCAPWNQCYICPPEPTAYLSRTESQRHWCTPCCSIGADISLLTPLEKENFLELVWNSLAFRLMRRHCNKTSDVLTTCRICRAMDKADPQNFSQTFYNLKTSAKEFYKKLNIPWPEVMEKRLAVLIEEEKRQLRHFTSL